MTHEDTPTDTQFFNNINNFAWFLLLLNCLLKKRWRPLHKYFHIELSGFYPLNISAVATRSSTSPSSRGYIREMARAHWVHAPTYVGWHRAARVSARRRSSRKQLPALFTRNRLGNFHSFCPRPVRETHRYRLHWKETTYLHLYSSGREQGEGVSGVYFFFFGSLRACHSFINTCVSSFITWISLIGLANYNLIVRSVYET